ncbi:MAG: aminotransferase class IV [Chitinophagaceae bacterium]
MSHFLLYNGSFYKNDEPLIGADNRGLRYGDGVFETLCCINGKIRFENLHFDRLLEGLQLLGFELPGYLTRSFIADQVNKLCLKNHHSYARVRINIFRGNGGLYDAENHFPNYIIQSWKLADKAFSLNENGLAAGIYRDAAKTMDRFSNLKTNNFLPYSMAALYAKSQQWNEAFVLNSNGRICDATIANVFLVKNTIISTPALSEGCIAGVMRRFLLEELQKGGTPVKEEPITEAALLDADEVFLTNSVKGIRWVQSSGDKMFTSKVTQELFNSLLKKMQ